MPVWLLILLILLGIAALVLGILLLTKKNLSNDDHPMAVQPEVAAVIPYQEPPVQQTKPAGKVPAASGSGQKAIRYKLRWGDTLWDLSETYYRNPWLYTKIAKHNKLKNPDLIISGTYIEIPPQ